MGSNPSPLSPTEWQMMVAVWELEEADASEVSRFLGRKLGRIYPPKTAGILLSRLAQKGYLRFTTPNPAGRGRPAHIYSPAIPREAALASQFARFLRDYLVDEKDFRTLRSLLAHKSN